MVEVEAAEGQDGVVEICLVADGELGEEVVFHYSVVVGRSKRGEETVGDGEEGHVLDVWVVFGGIGHYVMNVVVTFPPSQTQSTEEVGYDDPDDRVDGEIVRDAHVACIVGGED